MNIIISGGGGVLGHHISDELSLRGHRVVAFGKNLEARNNALISRVRANVNDLSSLSTLPSDCDVMIHAAGVSRVGLCESDPQSCVMTNVVGTLNVAEWCLKSPKRPWLVFLSSREVYGNPQRIPVSESEPLRPISIYGASKAMAETLIKSLGSRGLRYIILRLTNIYGSLRDHPGRAIPSFIGSALRNEPIVIYGGDQVLDFCHLVDFLKAVTKLVEKISTEPESVACETFNVCSGNGHKLIDVARTVIRLADSTSTITIKEPNPYDTRSFIGDYSKLRNATGYVPEIDLYSGLKMYVNEMKARTKTDL
ncbi:MAG: NAD(P)-dependent oxidoreductase [Aigarchaeota archaeon]|nr:NAD(P)-dependent oxidoreductase [Aigarchaeota archaeon]MDW8093048.1 NAD(P)-dependent oxidoreductase [Nitrososphaerota archaeon]